jgi:hypothetical protein
LPKAFLEIVLEALTKVLVFQQAAESVDSKPVPKKELKNRPPTTLT